MPLPLPPTIAAHLPPCPPAGDEPRLRLGGDAGLNDLRAALQADGSGDVQSELQGLIEAAQNARDVPTSDGDDGEEGADESYAGPGVDTNAGTNTADAGNGGGTKRGRDAACNGKDDDQNKDEEDDDEEEGLLAYHPDATVMLRNSYADTDVEDDGTDASAKGHLFVTTRRILFLSASSSAGGGDNDTASIDAGCVVLHALSECEERGWHVYCQLDDGSGGGGSGGDDSNGIPDEAYFYPSSEGAEGQEKDACQRMFDAFSALASLNPIYGDGDDNVGGGGGGGGFFSMVAGIGGMMMGGGDDEGGMMMMGGGDDADNDEIVCRLGEGINLNGGFGPTTDAAGEGDNGDGGATEEERAAMLERLDGMLMVPAEYEIASGEENENEKGGQFDDAEESGDELL